MNIPSRSHRACDVLLTNRWVVLRIVCIGIGGCARDLSRQLPVCTGRRLARGAEYLRVIAPFVLRARIAPRKSARAISMPLQRHSDICSILSPTDTEKGMLVSLAHSQSNPHIAFYFLIPSPASSTLEPRRSFSWDVRETRLEMLDTLEA